MASWTHRSDGHVPVTLGLVVAVLGLVLGGFPLGLFGSSNPPAGPADGLSLAASPGIAPSTTIVVNLTSVSNYTTPLNLSPLFYGVNIRADSPFTNAEAGYLNDTDTLTWRYPGGNIAEVFNYTNGSKWNGTTNVPVTNSVSNFIARCRSVHCNAILQLPAEINSTSTVTDYVSYVEQTLNFTPKVWEFGNEPSLWTNFARPIPTNGSDPNWPWANWGPTGGTNATPSTYAAIVPAIIQAIRLVDPSTPIDPLGGVGGGSANDSVWVYAVMKAAQQSASYISIHSYLGDPQAASNNSSFYRPVYNGKYTLPKILANVSASIRLACPNCTGKHAVGILASEAGVSNGRTNGKFETGFPMDMWNAVEAIQAARANLSSIDYFADYNGYPGSFITASGKLNPSYFLFKDITPFLGSTVLNVTPPSNDRGMLQVGGYWGSGNNWSLLIVNLDPQNNTTINLTGTSFPVHGDIEQYVWNGTTPEPIGHAYSWMNSTTLLPNSMELITVYPGPITKPLAPTGIFIASVNATQAWVTYSQRPGPIVNDTITVGNWSWNASSCATFDVIHLTYATAGLLVTGLRPSTWYCFAARASTAAGAGPPSNYVAVNTTFGGPTGFSAPSVGTDYILTTWTNPSVGPQDHLVKDMMIEGYATSSRCAEFNTTPLRVTTTTFNITGLQSGLLYCLQVEALDQYGNISSSQLLNVSTLGAGTLPRPPGLVSNTIKGGDESNFSTATIDVPAGDLILAAIGIRNANTSLIPSISDSANDLFTQLNGTFVSAVPGDELFVFESFPAKGSSSDSFTCAFNKILPGACEILVYQNVSPVQPIDTLGAVSSGGSVGQGFDPYDYLNTTSQNDILVLFASQASSSGGGVNFTSGNATLINWTQEQGRAGDVGETVGDGSRLLTGIVNNYTLSIASNGTKGSNWISFSVAIRGVPQLLPPTDLTVTSIGNTSLSLSWSNPTGNFSSDTVYYSTDRNFTPDYLGTLQTNATLRNLTPGTPYYIYVKVSNSTGLFGNTLVVVGTTLASTPAAPTDLMFTGVTTTSVSLSWTPARGPNLNSTVYQATYSTGSCGTYSIAVNSTGPNATTSTVEGLAPAETYCFEVVQWNATGPSNPSNSVTATTLPTAPTNVTAHPLSTTSINIDWTKPSGTLTDYLVFGEAGPSCGSATPINTSSVSTSYTVTGLTTNRLYCFYVEAVSEGGPSAPSMVVTNVTASVPAAPTFLSVSDTTDSSITLLWTNPSTGGLVNNTLYYGASCGSWTTSLTTDGIAVTYTISGLASGTTYCFAVQVWNTTGGSPLTTLNGRTLESPGGGGVGVLGLPGNEGVYLLAGLAVVVAIAIAGTLIFARRRSRPPARGSSTDPPPA